MSTYKRTTTETRVHDGDYIPDVPLHKEECDDCKGCYAQVGLVTHDHYTGKYLCERCYGRLHY